MGADCYEQPKQLDENQRLGRPNIGIGAGSVIENAIIDKNARIGRNVRIINEAGIVDSEEMPTHVIRDGIVVIPKFDDPAATGLDRSEWAVSMGRIDGLANPHRPRTIRQQDAEDADCHCRL